MAEDLEPAGRDSQPQGWWERLKAPYYLQTSAVYEPDYRPIRIWRKYLVAGIVFLTMSITLFFHTNSLDEIVIKYSDCPGTDCLKTFELKNKSLSGPLLIYYQLENFNQNHRSFASSRDDNQLAGKSLIGTTCNKTEAEIGTIPCGLMANTMFNDKIETFVNTERNSNPCLKEYDLSKKNLAFPLDGRSYKNPKRNVWDDKALKPDSWTIAQWEIFWKEEEGEKGGVEGEDFKVWMRTSALPTFRKLWYRIKSTDGPGSGDGLGPGVYDITIKNNWEFGENVTKKIIISQESVMGAKSFNKAIISLCVGLFFIMAAFLLRFVGNEMIEAEEKRKKDNI